jgi:hypothetical protein
MINQIDFSFVPSDIYLSDSGIYIKSLQSNAIIHKYTYGLDHVRSFGQSLDEKKPCYLPKTFKLLGIQNEKMYFIDCERQLQMKVYNETNGKFLKFIGFEDNKKNSFILNVDLWNNKIYFVYTSKLQIDVFDLNGLFLYHKKIDSKIQNIDMFYALDENSFAIVDKRNQLVYFF